MLISKFDNTNVIEKLESFEIRYNFTFPKIYRDFIIKYNGGITPKTKFKINKIGSDIRAFYGFDKKNDQYNYERIERSFDLSAYIAEDICPIAVNSFGDYIMIGVGEKNNGQIYFSYHDRVKGLEVLAENFHFFVDKCKSEKIGHIKTIEERKKILIDNGNVENIKPSLIKVWEQEIQKYENIHQEKLVIEVD